MTNWQKITLYIFFSCYSCNSFSQDIQLVSESGSRYEIYTSSNAAEITRKAGIELQKYLQQITDVKLPVTNKFEKSASLIVIGEAKDLNKLTNQKIFDDLDGDGFHIKTIGEQTFIAGGTDRGCLYGVYSFLEQYLGCRMYAPNALVIPKRSSIHLKPIDWKQVPQITYRETYMAPSYEELYANWHKIDHFMAYDKVKPRWGNWVHSMFSFVPPDEYFKSHPEYFSLRNGQRTASQLDFSQPAVLDLVVQNLKKQIAQNPYASIWSVSQQDNDNFSQDKTSSALDAKEESHAASLINFVNKVARNFPDKTISTLAYGFSVKPPKTIKPADNVQILFCTSGDIDRGKTYHLDQRNNEYISNITKWAQISKNLMVWDYVINYKHFLMPFPNITTMGENIKFFVKQGAKGLFIQGDYYPGGEFQELRTYIAAKLMWNPQEDINQIIDDFLNGFYGNAAPHIKKYITTLERRYREANTPLGLFDDPDMHKTGYLSLDALNEYDEILKQAEESVTHSAVHLNRVKDIRATVDYAYLHNKVADPLAFSMRTHSPSKKKNSPAIDSDEKRLSRMQEVMKRAKMVRIREAGTTPAQYYESMKKILSDFGNYSVLGNLAYRKKITLIYPGSPIHAKEAGDNALIDGIRGDLTTGRDVWEGFYGGKFEAIIDLGKTENFRRIAVNFMKALKVSVNYPEQLEFYYSIDGKNFRKMNIVSSDVKEVNKVAESEVRTYTATDRRKIKARYIRVSASLDRRYAMFLDEILLN